MATYACERGWAAGANGFTNQLREILQGEADRLDLEVGLTRTVQLDRQRRPIVPRIAASEVPASAAEAVRLVMEEMPERSVLEALVRPRFRRQSSTFGTEIKGTPLRTPEALRQLEHWGQRKGEGEGIPVPRRGLVTNAHFCV